ncbi:MAG: fatty acid desaturase, partial [Gammaproteobacteria bacterium]
QRVVLHTSGRFIEADLEHIPKGRQALLVLEARIFIAFYITLFAAAAMTGYLDMLLVVWLLPRLVGEPIQRMMRVAEHVGCEEGPDLLTNTRTTYSNAVFKALAWQMPYHAEHHLFPNTPFFALPKVHALVRDRVVVEPRGYIAGQIAVVRMLLRGESRC